MNKIISNPIESQEDNLIDDFEMLEILSNKELLGSLKKGSEQAKERKGRFVS